MNGQAGDPCRYGPTPAHCGRYLRVDDAGSSFWRAMQEYHRLIVEDEVTLITAARRHLKRARRSFERARQWGVTYDQIPMPGVTGSVLPELPEERDAHV